MDLVAKSVAHRTTPLHLRERPAPPSGGAAPLTRELAARES
jgi:hypothetical protein